MAAQSAAESVKVVPFPSRRKCAVLYSTSPVLAAWSFRAPADLQKNPAAKSKWLTSLPALVLPVPAIRRQRVSPPSRRRLRSQIRTESHAKVATAPQTSPYQGCDWDQKPRGPHPLPREYGLCS